MFKQAIQRSTKHVADHPINQSNLALTRTIKSTNQAFIHAISQSEPPTDQPINNSNNQPIIQSTNQPRMSSQQLNLLTRSINQPNQNKTNELMIHNNQNQQLINQST